METLCRIGAKGFGREKRRAESRGKSQTGWHSRARRGPRSRVTEKAFGSGDLTGTHEGKQNVERTITQPRGGDPGGDSQKPQLRRAAPMRLAALGRKSAEDAETGRTCAAALSPLQPARLRPPRQPGEERPSVPSAPAARAPRPAGTGLTSGLPARSPMAPFPSLRAG